MIRTSICLVMLACASPLHAQRPDVDDLRRLLNETVQVEVVQKRFVSVRIDSVANSSRDAALVNRDRRLFSYLVEHQLRPDVLYRGVPQAARPKETLIENLLQDSAAVWRLGEYRRTANGSATPSVRTATAVQLTEMGARFYHPMIQPDGQVVFYRCAGINGIPELGSRREPLLEAFAFWAIAPTVFDADTASAPGRALNARFRAVASTFRADVANAKTDTAVVARARARFYADLQGSTELQDVLRAAYRRSSTRPPFVVPEWADGRSKDQR